MKGGLSKQAGELNANHLEQQVEGANQGRFVHPYCSRKLYPAQQVRNEK